MSLVVIQHGQGGPEVFEVATRDVGHPGHGEVKIDQKAIGLNFIDVMFRNGTFPSGRLSVNGVEAAGVVAEVGPGTDGFRVGDRVGYHFSPGAYAVERLIPAPALVRLPDDVTFEQAAALLTKGMTARMAVKQAYRVEEGDTLVVTTAAGGIGSLVVRWAVALGATVIGVVGSEGKRHAAEANGAHRVVVGYDDATEAALALTDGRGADAVLDGVGGRAVSGLVPAVREGGTIVSFGSASGQPAPDRSALQRRAVDFSSPPLGQFLRSPADLQGAADDVFDALRRGDLGDPQITVRRLGDVARAHDDLQGRRTTGSTVLIP